MPKAPHHAKVTRRPFRRALFAAIAGLAMLAPAAQTAQARQGFAAIAVDARSGRILYARNIDSRRIPASVTKVMTLYLLFAEIRKGRYSLSSRLMISRHAASMQPSKLGLKPGSTITVDNAIRAVVTKSANDIAAAIAENIAGSESAFAYRMTRTARAMGMTRTTFRNASGLPKPPNVTTARDLATLALRIQRDFPRLYKRYFALRTFRYGRRVFRNHNHLLGRVRGMDGLKTGYTRAAGYNLAASTLRNGKRLVTVVLGAKSGRSRNAFMARLINQMFRTRPLTRGTAIAAVAGRPAGWRSAMARGVNFAPRRAARKSAPKTARATAKPAIAHKPARPSQLALLTRKIVRQPMPAAPTPPAPRPRKRPDDLVALKAAVAHKGETPSQSAGGTSKASLATPAHGRKETGGKPAGKVFASVRPQPGLTRLPGETAPGLAGRDKTAHEAAATSKARGPLYASLAVAPAIVPGAEGQRLDDASPAPSMAMPRAEAAQTNEIVIAKTMPEPDAGDVRMPRESTPGAQQVAAKSKETRQPLNGAASSGKAETPQTGPDYAPFLKSWNIQLGAYPSEAGAKSVLAAASKGFRPYLRGKQGYTMVFTKGAATYYRARFAGFGKASAWRTCRMMKRKKVSCFVLAPKTL